MKFLSNFDTENSHRLYQEAIAQHGQGNVIYVRRFFIFIAMRVILPMTFWVLFVAFFLYIAYFVLEDSWGTLITLIRRIIRSAIWLTWIYMISRSIKIIIDYYMDFTIITPIDITSYNQSMLFRRTVRTLDISKMKSVRVEQVWLLKSIFNYWSIVFFAEGDQSGEMWDITLHFITNPNKLREAIENLVQWHMYIQSTAQTPVTQQTASPPPAPERNDQQGDKPIENNEAMQWTAFGRDDSD